MTKVVCVGGRWEGVPADYLEISSDRSLLDYDLIIFTPELPPTKDRGDGSDRRARVEHWNKELQEALEHSKVVIVLCTPDVRFQYVTKTGRYTASTYDALPIDVPREDRSGGAVVGARDYQRAKEFLAPLIGTMSYALTFTGLSEEYLKTRTGNLIVGGAIRSKDGVLVLIPRPSLDPLPSAMNVIEMKAEALRCKTAFIRDAIAFARSFKARGRSEPPDWVTALPRTVRQSELEKTIESLEGSRSDIDAKISDMRAQLSDIQQFNGLVFENGEPLEEIVRRALTTMGFKAEKHDDGDRRFDLVAESVEGRLLGEVEGKDSTHVDIEKIRQLASNIDEDYERDEVSEPALGVLFGNSFRKLPPNERPPFFTEKAMNTASRRKIALVRTPDLLAVVQAIADGASEEFKNQCRRSIFDGAGGIVIFPTVQK